MEISLQFIPSSSWYVSFISIASLIHLALCCFGFAYRANKFCQRMLNLHWDRFHVAVVKHSWSFQFSKVYVFTIIITRELEFKNIRFACDSVLLMLSRVSTFRLFISYIILNGFKKICILCQCFWFEYFSRFIHITSQNMSKLFPGIGTIRKQCCLCC